MKQSPLYKFIGNLDDLRCILAGSLKFTPIADLNDPNELVPRFSFDAVARSLEELRRDGYTEDDIGFLHRQGVLLDRVAPNFRRISIPKTREEANSLINSKFYDNMNLLSKLLEKAAEKIAASVGVFCMTSRLDSLPMWAHYADNASGLVVEFFELDTTFPGDETGVLSEPIEVIYGAQLPTITFNPRSYVDMFFSKLSDWEYEREVRIILPLDDCTRRELDSKSIHTFDVPLHHIRRVYCGWQMERCAIDRVVGYAQGRNPDVEVWTTSISEGRVQTSCRISP